VVVPPWSMGEGGSNGRIVAVVDDDESVRVAIRSLLRSVGFRVEVFASAESFLDARHDGIACLIVDVRLTGMSGLDLQRQLAAAGDAPPVVFISAHDDPVARRQALGAGALAFLRKPFPERALIDAVRSAFGRPARS
jgi:FixJ family two-component response regulator